MSKLKGVCTYSIEKDGCLLGTYANDAGTRAGETFNEIAKKKDGESKDSIAGEYHCAWTEFTEGASDIYAVTGTLVIKEVKQNNSSFFELEWWQGNKKKFVGEGFQTGIHQLTARYTTV